MKKTILEFWLMIFVLAIEVGCRREERDVQRGRLAGGVIPILRGGRSQAG